MVTVVVGVSTKTLGGEIDVMLGIRFPPVPINGIVIGVVTPLTVTSRFAEKFPMAEGVNVMYIWQL